MKTYQLLLLLAFLSPGLASAFTVTETAKLTASDGAAGDQFGSSVGLEGDKAVVGSPLDDPFAENSGSAYAFARNANGQWQEQAKLLPPASGVAAAEDALFGVSVSLQGDDALIGMLGFDWGHAYVFTHDTDGSWTRSGDMVSGGFDGASSYGRSVILDDDTAFVAAPTESYNSYADGIIYVEDRDASDVWRGNAILSASDAGFNLTLGEAIAVDGDTLLATAAVGSGSTYPFTYPHNKIYVFRRNTQGKWGVQGEWGRTEQTQLLAPGNGEITRFGNALSIQNKTALISALKEDENGSQIGIVYVYARNTQDQWHQQTILTPPDDQVDSTFGSALVFVGNTALIKGRYEDDQGGAIDTVYVYTRNPQGQWNKRGQLLASDGEATDHFGEALALDGTTALVGAFHSKENGIDTGAAYVFDLPLAPQCNGYEATVYVDKGRIVGGPMDGENYQGELIGTNQDDVILGTPDEDIIKGRGGNDLICGEAGQDLVFGGNGNDLVLGGDGDDILKGQKGDDRLFGNFGDDILWGGDGNDTLRGGWNDDRCIQGETNINCEIVR